MHVSRQEMSNLSHRWASEFSRGWGRIVFFVHRKAGWKSGVTWQLARCGCCPALVQVCLFFIIILVFFNLIGFDGLHDAVSPRLFFSVVTYIWGTWVWLRVLVSASDFFLPFNSTILSIAVWLLSILSALSVLFFSAALMFSISTASAWDIQDTDILAG